MNRRRLAALILGCLWLAAPAWGAVSGPACGSCCAAAETASEPPCAPDAPACDGHAVSRCCEVGPAPVPPPRERMADAQGLESPGAWRLGPEVPPPGRDFAPQPDRGAFTARTSPRRLSVVLQR